MLRYIYSGNENVNFDQYVEYMVSISSDAASLVQLQDAFSCVTNNKDFITESEMKVAQLPEDQVKRQDFLPPRIVGENSLSAVIRSSTSCLFCHLHQRGRATTSRPGWLRSGVAVENVM